MPKNVCVCVCVCVYVVKCLKCREKKPRILHPIKLSFKSERERLPKENKNWENVLPVDLFCKKCLKKIFREEENNIDKMHDVSKSIKEEISEDKNLFFLFYLI